MVKNLFIKDKKEDEDVKFLDIIRKEVKKKTSSMADYIKVRKAVEKEKLSLNRKLQRFNQRQEVSQIMAQNKPIINDPLQNKSIMGGRYAKKIKELDE